jgi:hypothetical protein
MLTKNMPSLRYNNSDIMLNDKEGNWRIQELYGNLPLKESSFLSNKISSTRYTLATLLPKNLFEQFQRTSNL